MMFLIALFFNREEKEQEPEKQTKVGKAINVIFYLLIFLAIIEITSRGNYYG